MTSAADVARRPGGRNERNRMAVAEAVLGFLREGRLDFSTAEVAGRAGLHRSTVYRRWPSSSSLLREALALHTSALEFVETGTWSIDLPEMIAALGAFFSGPAEMAMNAAMVARTDEEIADVLLEHWRPILAALHGVVRSAQERGEVASDADPVATVGMAVSPLLVTTTFLRRPPSRAEINQLTALLRRATAP